MVNKQTTNRNTYQDPDGLERAVIDLIRVGVTGHSSGVRQLAARLVRALPSGVHEPETFTNAVHEAMLGARESTGLRFAQGEVPQDGDTHPLVDVDPFPDGAGLVLDPASMEQLAEIVAERQQRKQLAMAGVAPTRSLLISGPPGVGKTLAARWLSNEIGIPLVSLDLASVVSSYLGSSGRNIKSVLRYAQSGPCVLLLDEFDAVAKRRDDDTDIGELKRIVNVLLVELDRWPDTSLLVAATNHPQLLDPAVGRRFDRQLELVLPGRTERERILLDLAGHDVDEQIVGLCADALNGMSGSDLVRLWNSVRRKAVLAGKSVSDAMISEMLALPGRAGAQRDRAWLAASERLGMSARQIAQLAGVSHPTVSAALRKAKDGNQ